MMLDPPYILTHPLLRSIMMRRAELKEQAESLPQGSAERKTLEKRISHLEQYRLPKEDERDAEQRENVFEDSGKKIGERHSVRKRMIERRRGRREEFTIKARCSIRRKIGSSGKPWRVIATQFELKDALELRRAVLRLKEVPKSEGVRISIPEDCSPACGAKSFFE
jgi:hypothetical protein